MGTDRPGRDPSPPLASALAALVLACGSPAPARAAADDGLELLRDLQARGQWAQAESLSVALIERFETGPVIDSLALAEALHGHGLALFKRQALADTVARGGLERALAIRRARLPPYDERVAETRYILARLHLDAGRPDTAAGHLRELIETRRPHVSTADTLMAEAWRALAVSFRDRSDFAGAIAAFDSAIAWRSRGYGEDRFVALAIAEIGWCHVRLGDHDRARDSLMRSLSTIQRGHGRDDFAATAPFGYLAGLERRTGRLVLGMDYEQEAIRIARLSYRDDEYEVARLRRNLANFLGALGDYAGALAVLERVRPVYLSTFGSNHWRVANLMFSIGNVKAAAKDSSGLRELREAEAFYSARPGPPDPELMRVLHSRGALLFDLGRFREALETAERGLEIAARTPRPLRIIQGQLLMLRAHALVQLRDLAALGAARDDMLRFAREHGLDRSRLTSVLIDIDAQALHCLGRDEEAWARALEAEASARDAARQVARSESDDRAVINSSRLAPHLDLVFELARFGAHERFEVAWDRCVRNRGMVRAEVERRRLPAELRADSAVAAAHGRWLAAQRALARAGTEGGAGGDSARRAEFEHLRDESAASERVYPRARRAPRRAAGERPRARRRHGPTLPRIGARVVRRDLRDFRQRPDGRPHRARRAAGSRLGRPRALIGTGRRGPGLAQRAGHLAARRGPRPGSRARLPPGRRDRAAPDLGPRGAGARGRRGCVRRSRRTPARAVVAGAARAGRPLSG